MATGIDEANVMARILYWGVEGAGKSTTLKTIHAKLKPEKRGDLERVPTRLDPTAYHEELVIELGSVQGRRTQLLIIAPPSGAEHAPTRKQLLDRVDGIVLVLDSRSDRVEENLASVAELRTSLGSYGLDLADVMVVVQYNHRDQGDPYAIEQIHRGLALPDAPVFETVATAGQGILQALTTISKQVIRAMRERSLEPEPVDPRPEPTSPSLATRLPEPPPPAAPAPRPPPAQIMEEAILREGGGSQATDHTVAAAQSALDRPWSEVSAEAKQNSGARIGADLRIVSVGTASRSGERSVRLPLVLGNDEGETVTLALTIQLDPLLDDESA